MNKEARQIFILLSLIGQLLVLANYTLLCNEALDEVQLKWLLVAFQGMLFVIAICAGCAKIEQFIALPFCLFIFIDRFQETINLSGFVGFALCIMGFVSVVFYVLSLFGDMDQLSPFCRTIAGFMFPVIFVEMGVVVIVVGLFILPFICGGIAHA